MNHQPGAPRGLASLLQKGWFHYNSMSGKPAVVPEHSILHSLSSQLPHPSTFKPRGIK